MCGKCRRACIKTRSCQGTILSRSCADVMAGRAGELRLRNSAAIEQSLEQLHLKHDWVVVDAVSPANDRLPFLERIPGKAKARAKVPMITIGSDAQHSSDPDAGLARLDIQ